MSAGYTKKEETPPRRGFFRFQNYARRFFALRFFVAFFAALRFFAMVVANYVADMSTRSRATCIMRERFYASLSRAEVILCKEKI
ncbi:hypothetical protein KGQ72_01875 [Patescibacteria group bacterium]|nr:hypothetical protein [Patescibacteria group bacterium]